MYEMELTRFELSRVESSWAKERDAEISNNALEWDTQLTSTPEWQENGLQRLTEWKCICIINGEKSKPNMRNGIWHVFFCVWQKPRNRSHKRIYICMWQYALSAWKAAHKNYDISREPENATETETEQRERKTRLELNEIACLMPVYGACICDLIWNIFCRNRQWLNRRFAIWHFMKWQRTSVRRTNNKLLCNR